jgi:2-oxoglutarate ferredoxin oxidoreductase subunit gamma
MEDSRYEILISGSGGQGIILAAIVLAEAAGVYGRKFACQTQSYGPEPRGGASKAEVVISRSEIDYPKTIHPDLLLTMTQASCDTYFSSLKHDGLLIADSSFVKQIPTKRVVSIPFTRISQEVTGGDLAANMTALGAIGHICKDVTLKSIESALKARMPEGTIEMNLKALKAGEKAARKIDLDSLPPSVEPEEEEV